MTVRRRRKMMTQDEAIRAIYAPSREVSERERKINAIWHQTATGVQGGRGVRAVVGLVAVGALPPWVLSRLGGC